MLRSRSALLVLFLLVGSLPFAAGCGGEDDSIPNQSETAQAIRAKVEEQMEKERLKRISPRLENAIAAASQNLPTPPAGSAAPAESAGEEKAVRPAAELYAQNCASCHGPSGKGDGPLSAGLNPQPAKHADGNYMNALSNDHIFKVVKEGGAAVGKSPMMAPWGSSISDEEIKGLVGFIRGLADPAYTGEMP